MGVDLEETLGLSQTGTIEISLWLRATGDTEVYPFGIFFDSSQDYLYRVSLNLDTNQICEKGPGVPSENEYFAFPTKLTRSEDGGAGDFRTWHRLVLTLNRKTGILSMMVDGELAVDSVHLDGPVTKPGCLFGLGVFDANQPPVSWDGYFDNVMITAK